jgi:DNA-binding NtrC family response regulator
VLEYTPKGRAHMRKILIVDDEPAVAALLQKAFLASGYEVRVAANGAQAMEACEAETFDLLLSDVVMPSINGHELARWFAANHPSGRTVLMSGYDLGCQKCPYSPRCKLLEKPFSPTEVVAYVRELFSGGTPTDPFPQVDGSLA